MHLCVAALAGMLALPVMAQTSNARQVAADAQAAANLAADKAKAAEAKAKAAEKTAADIRAGIMPPPPAGSGDKFTTTVVRSYSDALNAILAQLKATTTAAQAAALADKIHAAMPNLESALNTIITTYAAYANSGARTADNANAEKMLADTMPVAEAIGQEMDRVQKLNPALAADFTKFRALQQD